MDSIPEIPTPRQLWSALDTETRTLAASSIYRHAWDDESMRLEADRAIASTLKFRDTAVRRLPLEKRIDYLARVVRPEDSLATTLLLALHLAHRKELLGAFLDALAIPHNGGVIDGDYDLGRPEAGRLTSAVEQLRTRFPENEIQVYMASLLVMDPDSWSGLADLVRPLLAG